MAYVKSPQVQMSEASDDRGRAEDETDAKADEIEGVHDYCLPRLLELRVCKDLRWMVEAGSRSAGCKSPLSGRST